MFALITPLLPLVALPILYYGGVLDDFWAHFIALLYVAWLLINSLPANALRIVLRITAPMMLLGYAISSDAVSRDTGNIIGLVWLLFMMVLLLVARRT